MIYSSLWVVYKHMHVTWQLTIAINKFCVCPLLGIHSRRREYKLIDSASKNIESVRDLGVQLNSNLKFDALVHIKVLFVSLHTTANRSPLYVAYVGLLMI